MRRFTRDLFLTAFVISLFIHLISGVYVLLKKPFTAPESVEVVFVDKEDMKKMRQLQIVEQSEKQLNNEVDEKAKYLSRFNQKVVEETKAANSGKFRNDARQGPAPKADQNKIAEKKNKSQKAETKSANIDVGGLPKLAALKPQFQWEKATAGVQNPGPVSQTDDHLKDAQLGAETMLSSREFVYYSYYSRIKERLRVFWEPKIKEKVTRIFMTGRKIASDEDRVTKLVIVLDRTGTLIKVQVLSESGLKDLDDAAIEAFQAAAPFPNPPAGIVEADGTIKIRWDFVIEAQAAMNALDRPVAFNR